MARRILVVDDEKELVDLLCLRFQSCGYETLTAYDGQEALEKARKEKPDLILLDLMLPKMDGYKVCGLLKGDSRYQRIPIVLFTARAQETDKAMGKEAGADAYVTKPFEPKALLATIENLLKRE